MEKYPDVDEICQQIKEKYEYGDKDYMIIAPDRIEDIISEGHILGIACIGATSILNGFKRGRAIFSFCVKQANRISHIIRWR